MPGVLDSQTYSKLVLGLALASVLPLAAGCGSTRSESEPPATAPEHLLSGPSPSAEEVCDTETEWPDSVRFITPRHVLRRFKAKTGVTLERERSLDFPGARTFFQGPRAWGLPGSRTRRAPASDRLFGGFSLSVVDPRCPALVEWLGADGDSGAGGLVWHHEIVWEGTCWSGDKRYSKSNLVVHWYADDCGWHVNSKWKRLNAVLTEITTAGR